MSVQINALDSELFQNALVSLKGERAKIHNGSYPSEILHAFGEAGLYASFAKNGVKGLQEALLSVQKVSESCGNSGFCVWCHQALLWYLLNSTNKTSAQKELFSKLASGEILGGTGLSNPLKAFVGLDKMRLSAKRVKGGFVINGTLAWVSNLASRHYFAFIAEVEEDSKDSQTLDSQTPKQGGRILDSNQPKNVEYGRVAEPSGIYFREGDTINGIDSQTTKQGDRILDSNQPKNADLPKPKECIMALACCQGALSLKPTTPFCALEGSGTYATQFRDYFVSDEMVLANPASAMIPKINAGFVLLQCGMGLGMSEGAIRATQRNCYNKARLQTLCVQKEKLEQRVLKLAQNPYTKDAFNASLRVKLAIIKLLNELVTLCILHNGASGYFQGAFASKLLLESAFFGIVSPSQGHIQKILEATS
ncbi:acyl-CoA dehydrogenase [Helicobacter himalayensis]|uniref:acyl-CoA dehydrogenase n=1 Tax=Helicobacter himalayensis TaxID=1591088 RepID=UPI0008339D18|nr:acyl-CoA dehydrogenase [Helicobacter himalayensis]